ncbi:hypothetical protein MYX65_03755 [Acidobacteria bacterium AH-259-L09]|nr:hypothetical protein [Acidobacteria bacterium AH-259-L09]
MRILHLIVVLAAWCLFLGEAAAQYVGMQPLPPIDGGSVGVGTGARIDVETVTPKQIRENLVFPVKFLCGEIPSSLGSLAEGSPLAPGSYRTAINIHNPNPQAVTFLKKAVIANPQGQPRGAISLSVEDVLEADEALEVDCVNILSLFNNSTDEHSDEPSSAFVKGFVVITVSPPKGVPIGELDVVGVYTLKNVDVITGAPDQVCLPDRDPCKVADDGHDSCCGVCDLYTQQCVTLLIEK